MVHKLPRLTVAVRMNAEIAERLRQLAEADNRTLSQWIETILIRYLQDNPPQPQQKSPDRY